MGLNRRNTFDPFSLEQRRYPHELRVVDRFSQSQSVRKVPAGSDLKAEFLAELARWAAEGWTIEEPYKGNCFMHRGADRWFVSLRPDPDYHGPPFQPDGSPWQPPGSSPV